MKSSYTALSGIAELARHAGALLDQITPEHLQWDCPVTVHPSDSIRLKDLSVRESYLSTVSLGPCTLLDGHYPIVDNAILFSQMHHNGEQRAPGYLDGNGHLSERHSKRLNSNPSRVADNLHYYLLSGYTDNIWHFIYNYVLRLGYVKKRYGSLTSAPFTYLIPQNLKPDFYHILEFIGLSLEKCTYYSVEHPISLPNLTVTITPFCLSGGHLYGSRAAASNLRPLDTRKSRYQSAGDKIYLSRGDARWRRTLNEEELIPQLIARGFRVVRLTDLTIPEMANAFDESRIVVGASGANMAATFFCRPGAKVVELSYNRMIQKYYFQASSAAHGLEHHKVYGDAVESERGFHLWDFTVPVDVILALLDELE